MVSAEGASRYLDPALFKPRFLDQVDAVVLSAYALVGGLPGATPPRSSRRREGGSSPFSPTSGPGRCGPRERSS